MFAPLFADVAVGAAPDVIVGRLLGVDVDVKDELDEVLLPLTELFVAYPPLRLVGSPVLPGVHRELLPHAVCATARQTSDISLTIAGVYHRRQSAASKRNCSGVRDVSAFRTWFLKLRLGVEPPARMSGVDDMLAIVVLPKFPLTYYTVYQHEYFF